MPTDRHEVHTRMVCRRCTAILMPCRACTSQPVPHHTWSLTRPTLQVAMDRTSAAYSGYDESNPFAVQSQLSHLQGHNGSLPLPTGLPQPGLSPHPWQSPTAQGSPSSQEGPLSTAFGLPSSKDGYAKSDTGSVGNEEGCSYCFDTGRVAEPPALWTCSFSIQSRSFQIPMSVVWLVTTHQITQMFLPGSTTASQTAMDHTYFPNHPYALAYSCPPWRSAISSITPDATVAGTPPHSATPFVRPISHPYVWRSFHP